MKIFTPSTDGIDHINIYSKGKTSLGRWLSNFAKSPIETEDGHFDSIEGYWYWLSSKDDTLRSLSGWEAKSYGRSIGARDWLDENAFKDKIKRAIRLKLDNNPERLNELKICNLPLTHYYVYNDKIVRVPKADWIIDFLESIKSENNLTEQKTRVVNIRKSKYNIYIGRAGHGQTGYFGNPHPVGYCEICKKIHDREEALSEFKKYFYQKIASDPTFKERVLSMKGKTLGCFCKPNNCHGDIYVEWLEKQE